MRTMEMFKLLMCAHFLLILILSWLRLSSAIQLCQSGVDTTDNINLNMDSSEISRSSGMCSCRIQLIHDARLQMFPDLTVLGCSTTASLSDSSFVFPCSNGKIGSPTSYSGQKTAGDVLWLFVTSTDVSQAMSGQLLIKTTRSSSEFKLVCFDSNTNTSVTTQVLTTTTTTTHTTPTTTPSLVVSSAITIKATTTTSTTFRTTTTTTTTVSTVSVVLCKAVSTISSQNTSAAVAGGIAGGVTLLIIIVIVSVFFHRRYRCVRRTTNDQIPESRDHPTYSDLTNREHTEYEHIDHNNATTRVYQNVALDIREYIIIPRSAYVVVLLNSEFCDLDLHFKFTTRMSFYPFQWVITEPFTGFRSYLTQISPRKDE